MKMIKTAVCALAVAGALLAGNASAEPTPTAPFTVLSVSGTSDFYKTNYFKLDKKGTNTVDTNYVETTATQSFNNKSLYNLLSNALANASSLTTNALTSTNLPADGYIAFNLVDYDGGPENGNSFFYVTNKSGFFFPLSGLDTNRNYYSYIELDTQVPYYSVVPTIGWYGEFEFGDQNDNDFNDVGNFSYDKKTGDGSAASTSYALLYIHDNPYSYDAPDFIYNYNDNMTAIEIWGAFKVNITYKGGEITAVSGTLKGTGNVVTDGGDDDGVITTATATLSK